MGFVIKESLKSTVISLAGAVLGALSIVLATRAFPQQEYGLQQSLSRNTTLTVYLLALGFDYVLLVLGQRFPPGSAKRGAFLKFSALVPFVFFLLSCVPVLLFKDSIINAITGEDKIYINRYFYAYPVICFLYLGLFWMSGYIRSIERSTFAFFINEVLLRLIVLVLVVLYWMGVINLDVYVWLFAISFVIPLVWTIYTAKKYEGFTFSGTEALSKEDKRYILDFGFFHMMIVFAAVLAFQIDGFLFLFLSEQGLTNIAVFSVCIYAVSIMRTPSRVLGQNAIPTFTRHYDEGNMAKLRELYQRSSLNLQMLTTFLSLILLLNLDNIQLLADLWKNGYEEIRTIIPIMLLGVYIEMCCGLNFEILGVSKYYRVSFYLAVVYLLLIIAFYYFLVKSLGLIGAAWAFTITMILFSLMRSIVVYRLFKMLPWVRDSLKVLVAGACSCVALLLPQLDNVFADIIVRSVVGGGIFLSVCYFWRIGEDMHRIVDLILQRIKERRNIME